MLNLTKLGAENMTYLIKLGAEGCVFALTGRL